MTLYTCRVKEKTSTGERDNGGPLRKQLLAKTVEDQNAPTTADLCVINGAKITS